MYPFRRILAATDFGPSSEQAVEMACALSVEHGSKLILVHAYAIFVPIYPIAIAPSVDSVREAAEGAMERLLAELRPRVPIVTGFVRHGDAHTEILAQADESIVDLIVMGTHGHRGISKLFLGSEAEKVVRMSLVPVLTVRAKSSASEERAA